MTELFGRTSAGRVHVLRQSFRPSQLLKELIEKHAGPSIGPDFILHSTKQVLVDSVEYSRGEYREQDKLVREALKEIGREPLVIGNATIRLAGIKQPISEDRVVTIPKKLRVNLFPVDDSRLEHLASLLDIYPSVGPSVPPPHHLYIDLPLTHIPTRAEIEQRDLEINQDMQNRSNPRLLAATVLHVMASEWPRNLRTPSSTEAAS